ncbi:MAG: hypothetical protein ACI9UA_005631 [Pseudoalteromonas tetraodonis]|jgi:hypothetical protein
MVDFLINSSAKTAQRASALKKNLLYTFQLRQSVDESSCSEPVPLPQGFYQCAVDSQFACPQLLSVLLDFKQTRLAQLVIAILAFFGPALTAVSVSAGEPLSAAIDRLIADGADGPLAARSDDAEFLRRVTLDFAGHIPTADGVRAFIDDPSADKRSKLIDKLLAADTFAEQWADRLSVMLLERRNLGTVTDEDWRKYLHHSLQGAPRWNEMVRAMIAGSGKGDERPAMKFLGAGDQHRLTEDIGRLLLGMDLKCAMCHDHPSVDDWKQAHYWGLFAYVNQTKLSKPHPVDKKVYFVESLATEKVEFESVFVNGKEFTGPKLPDGEEVPIPEFEKGQEFERPAADGMPAVPKFRPREHLADDLTSKSNAYFVRNSVNRIWFLLMGRGLSHPLDQMHSENPPSHPALMDLLAEEFVAHEFDLKWLLREIASSESYQRSSRLPGGVRSVEPSSYRSALHKGLTPEQLLHAILRATGNLAQVEAAKGDPAVDAQKFDQRGYFTGTNKGLPQSLDDIRAIFVQTFAQPAGVAEVDFSPGLNKSLFLMNDRLILHWLEPRGGNLVERLGKENAAEAIAENLYLSVLSRFPDEAEQSEVAGYLQANAERRDTALGELVWALLCSTEFRLNH